MMKTLDMFSKNHPDKHKSGLHQLKSHRTPKESQDILGLVRCSPGGSQT